MSLFQHLVSVVSENRIYFEDLRCCEINRQLIGKLLNEILRVKKGAKLSKVHTKRSAGLMLNGQTIGNLLGFV